jgi:ferric-dicitrate binding protein FerR (iron transport regulator)
MSKSQSSSEKETFLANWIAGELSDSALKQYVSEAEFEAFVKLRNGIGVYELLESPMDNTYARILERTAKKKGNNHKTRRVFIKLAIPIAASLLLLAGLAYFFSDATKEISTGFGEQRTIAMLDGSEILLNARSVIRYNEGEWDNKRLVNLEGEAFFKVKAGSNFKVVTDNGSVVVLGTQFNIIDDAGFFEVACYDGKVRVTHLGKEYVLTPHNAMRSTEGVVTEFEFDPVAAEPTWISGESSFRSVPLKQVISALEKQFNVTFVKENIDDSVVFTGSFSNRDLSVALASVFRTVELHYTVLNDKIILSK